ncbi:hypothetical protein [Anaeromyxobacter oryzisoli]|uniref:hypothetical protein n=1 Tax=Anaeromyxobacter oryzisoli TaxID=2925408 RepID=UPI001F59B8CE|nr:hypothetical protein [Anaeromyxobacter sp. SG63]
MNRASTMGIAVLVALALAPAAVAAGAGAPKPRVAVMAAPGGASAPSTAAARSAAAAAQQAGADAMSPDEVGRIVGSTASAAACATDAGCVVATCAAARADYLLVTSVTDAGAGWRVEVRLRDGKRGSLRGQGMETVARDERLARDATARLAQRLVGSILVLSGELPPPVMPSRPVAPPAATAARAAIPSAPPSLSARPPAPARTSAVPPVEAGNRGEPTAASSRHVVGNILLGSGAALIVGAAASGTLAWAASNDANAALARGDLGRAATSRSSSNALAWSGVALGGAGAVALAAGAWLHLGDSTRVSVGLEPGMAGARVALAF